MAEIFYQPDSYKSHTLIDPDRWSQEHLWITKDFWIFGGLLVGTERTASSQIIYWKDSLAQRTCRTAEGPGSATGKNQKEAMHQIIGWHPSAERASGNTAAVAGLQSTWPLALNSDGPDTTASTSKGLLCVPTSYYHQLLFPVGTYNWWALCTFKSVPWLARLLGSWYPPLQVRERIRGSASRKGRAFSKHRKGI